MSGSLNDVYVSAGHLVLFADDVSDGFKEDVLSSSLYFQLAASHQCSKFHAFKLWCDVYQEAMVAFGWPPVSRNTRSYRIESEKTFYVWGEIKNRLVERVSPALLVRFEQLMVERQAATQTNRAYALFFDHCVSSPLQDVSLDGHDPVLSVQHGSGGVTLSLLLSFVSCEQVVTSVFLSFKTAETVGEHPLLQNFTSGDIEGHLVMDVISSEMAGPHYRRVRERINARLGDKKQTLIMGFNEVSS